MTTAKDFNPPRPKRAGPATRTNPTTGGFQISHELWEVFEPVIRERVNTHWFGGGQPQVPDRTCANGICPGSIGHPRFQEWVAAGVFLVL